MTSNAFLHYIFAITLLLSSSFAVFHGSMHLEASNIALMSSSHAMNHDHFHAEFGHDDEDELPRNGQHIESLCEVCFVLSSLTALGFGYTSLNASVVRSKVSSSALLQAQQKSLLIYFSRAPPHKA